MFGHSAQLRGRPRGPIINCRLMHIKCNGLLPYVCIIITIGYVRFSFTYETQQYGQKYQAMRGAKHHDTQVHSKVKYLEDLSFGKRQYNDSNDFRQSDSRKDLYRKRIHKLYIHTCMCTRTQIYVNTYMYM